MFTWWTRWRTRRATTENTARPTGERAALPSYSITAATCTDVGQRRTINEDCIRHVAHSDRDALLLVADGMGGHAAGEVASRMAVDCVADCYAPTTSGDVHAALKSALAAANRAIEAAAERADHQRGMGTTCLALAIRGGRAYCAYVGDSRLYLLRSGTLYRMSEDHSLVRQLLNQGLLTPEEARRHEDSHVVLRALGTRPVVAVTTWPAPFAIQPGDRFLACTDGLYDLVSDDAIARIVQAYLPEAACTRLVAEANARGGSDNVSAGVLHVEAPRPRNAAGPSAPAASQSHPVTP